MKKLFLMFSLVVMALTFAACPSGTTSEGDKPATDGDQTEVKGTVVDLANFSVTLPEGWKEGYKSETNLNAANEAGDVDFSATYNDMGPTLDQLKTYGDNLVAMVKGQGETPEEPKIDDKVLTLKSVKDGKINISYAVMKEDKIGVAGSIKFPEAKAAECEPIVDQLLKGIAFK